MADPTPTPKPQASGPARWSPFDALRQEIDRAFEQFSGFPRLPGGVFGAAGGAVVAVDMVEKDDGYELTAELPGLDPQDVQLGLAGRMLTISGEKKEHKQSGQGGVHVSERRFGSFSRSFPVPENVDAERIAAAFANGVLTVHMPKSQAAQAATRKIEIRSG